MDRQKPTVTLVDLRKAKLAEMQAEIDRLRAEVVTLRAANAGLHRRVTGLSTERIN